MISKSSQCSKRETKILNRNFLHVKRKDSIAKLRGGYQILGDEWVPVPRHRTLVNGTALSNRGLHLPHYQDLSTVNGISFLFHHIWMGFVVQAGFVWAELRSTCMASSAGADKQYAIEIDVFGNKSIRLRYLIRSVISKDRIAWLVLQLLAIGDSQVLGSNVFACWEDRPNLGTIMLTANQDRDLHVL